MKKNHEPANRDFKGIWIPKEVWLNPDLSLMEKVFLVEINSLDNDDGCFASNDYFAKFFGITRQRASQIIMNLRKKGILKISYSRKKDSQEIEKRTMKVSIKFSLHVSNKFSKGIKFSLGGCQENVEENNTCINNTINNTTNSMGSACTSYAKEDTFLFNACRQYWLNEVHPSWGFDGAQGKALKSILKRISNSIKQTGSEITDTAILSGFKALCSNLPIFYQSQNLTAINANYDPIISQIKNSKNGTTNSKGANAYTNSIFA